MNTRTFYRALPLLRVSEAEAFRSHRTQARSPFRNAVAAVLFSRTHAWLSWSHTALNGKNCAGNRQSAKLAESELRTKHDGINSRGLTSDSFSKGIMDEGWPEHEFSAIAEASLETISEVISDLGFNSDRSLEDFDIELSQGVLTVSLGDNGTYVLNTQTPNRQIWLSSPSSGPWRYGWNPSLSQWISTRDGHSLSDRLSKEFGALFNGSVSFSFSVMDS
ncbi:frataxin [Gracilaria domingensis]|nr:frataxin [Gracilaria domingensis]